MKKTATTLALLALLALIPFAPASAEPPAAVPTDVADFLSTLAAAPSQAPAIEGLAPAPDFLTTIPCTTHADCPTGKLCCYPCGVADCSNVCMTPVRGRCPLFP